MVCKSLDPETGHDEFGFSAPAELTFGERAHYKQLNEHRSLIVGRHQGDIVGVSVEGGDIVLDPME